MTVSFTSLKGRHMSVKAVSIVLCPFRRQSL